MIGYEQDQEFTPSTRAAQAALMAVFKGGHGATLPPSPKDLDLPVECPAAKARLSFRACGAMQERAVKALEAGDWTDSMAWFCGHCDNAPYVPAWELSPTVRLYMSWVDGELEAEPLNEYPIKN